MAHDATDHTRAAHRAAAADPLLDFSDERDFLAARRGFLGSIEPPVVAAADGRTVWDLRDYAFLGDPALGADGPPAPLTVHPSLWRQARLNLAHGLHRIHDRIVQVRGYDLSVMSVVEGDTGFIVVDPLVTEEVARASLDLVRRHLGERPVLAVIYTHSHVDHFGGVLGVTTPDDVAAGRTRVFAPEGFLDAAVRENVVAGTVMGRRSVYMYGARLEKGPRGQVDAGLGKTTSGGTVSVIAPTDEITVTGTRVVIDGVEFEFHLTPGTEAPAEMNFALPEFRALCMAENCSRTLHILYTPRGAPVRDARVWSRYLDDALVRYGADTDLCFTSHHWPVWGTEAVVEYLEKQRDMYRYLHDQTLRLANRGETMVEIAEQVELPPELAREWYSRGYYGTVNHDVKAVYQHYLGYFDGNPAHLHPHPPVEAARRYVEYMGGADAVLSRARTDFERGDYRWVAEVVHHVVFADPENLAARELEAAAFEQLGYQSESAVWRNFYLMGAQELRTGVPVSSETRMGPTIFQNVSISLVLDALAVRIDGPRAIGVTFAIDAVDTDDGTRYAIWLQNAVLHHRVDAVCAAPDVVLEAGHDLLAGMLYGVVPLADAIASGLARSAGDPDVVSRLHGLLDRPDPAFPIVLP